MKRNNLHVGLMAFAMLLIGASCSDDDNTSIDPGEGGGKY